MISDEYAAGLFDGEGCIHLYKNGKSGYGLVISMVQVDPSPLFALQDRFGGSVKDNPKQADRARGMKSRDQKRWYMTGPKKSFIQAISPHAITKRAQLEMALQYITEFGEGMPGRRRSSVEKSRQEWYYNEFHRLKRMTA